MVVLSPVNPSSLVPVEWFVAVAPVWRQGQAQHVASAFCPRLKWLQRDIIHPLRQSNWPVWTQSRRQPPSSRAALCGLPASRLCPPDWTGLFRGKEMHAKQNDPIQLVCECRSIKTHNKIAEKDTLWWDGGDFPDHSVSHSHSVTFWACLLLSHPLF